MKIRFKRMTEEAIKPEYGSGSAAGLDLCALVTDESRIQEVPPKTTVKVRTGMAVEIPEGYFGAVFARSGLATKSGLRPANCVGVIDSDYRGEIIVALHNDSCESRVVKHGDRIAQMVIMPYRSVVLEESDSLTKTGRGDGGFGSTGA